ncbi:MAG: cation diffusion facilitator family transporter [Gammaproteobacteria bacterium]
MNGVLTAQQTLKLKYRVTAVSIVVNLCLAVLQMVVGWLGHSMALVADAIHTLSDMASDFFVLIAVKLGSRAADHDHPYGHRRFETIATVLLGSLLVAVAGLIAWKASQRILQPASLPVPSLDTLKVAALCILAKEWLYRYTKRIAKMIRSKLLLANAWHHRSDAFSSVVVLFGIGAAFYGYRFADAAAAAIVALMIAKMGVMLTLESLKQLVDTGLPDSVVNDIRTTILDTEGVQDIHHLRTRHMGDDALVDAHLVVDPRISVSEGHVIGDAVRAKLLHDFEDVSDVLVHIDPEDDADKSELEAALTRQDIIVYLRHYLGDISHRIEDVNIHYLNGGVEVEVIVPQALLTHPHDIEAAKRRCQALEDDLETIEKVVLFLKV